MSSLSFLFLLALFFACVSISAQQSPVCGNGIVEAPEQCDEGQLLHPQIPLRCCTLSCRFKNAGDACGPRESTCFDRPRCDVSGTCQPSRMKRPGSHCPLGNLRAGKCNRAGVCIQR